MTDRIEDNLIDWSHVHERDMPIELEIQKTTQNIMLLSQNIAILEAGEGITEHIPRKDDLISVLKANLDAEYVILDRQNKVKAMKELELATYVPKVRKTRKKNTAAAINDFNELLKEVQRKYHTGG